MDELHTAPLAATHPLLYQDSQGELLTQAPPVLLLRLHSVEVGQLDDIWPHCWTGAPTEPADNQKSRVWSVSGMQPGEESPAPTAPASAGTVIFLF